jgi:hypothetical protein
MRKDTKTVLSFWATLFIIRFAVHQMIDLDPDGTGAWITIITAVLLAIVVSINVNLHTKRDR